MYNSSSFLEIWIIHNSHFFVFLIRYSIIIFINYYFIINYIKYTYIINFFFYFDYSFDCFLSVYSLLFDFTKYSDFLF